MPVRLALADDHFRDAKNVRKLNEQNAVKCILLKILSLEKQSYTLVHTIHCTQQVILEMGSWDL